MSFIAIDKLNNLHDGYRKQVVVKQKELLLIQEQGEHYLIQASCPHLHWPLMAAQVLENSIQCKKHGMSFCLKTGQGINDAAQGCNALAVYSVAYEGNLIGTVAT